MSSVSPPTTLSVFSLTQCLSCFLLYAQVLLLPFFLLALLCSASCFSTVSLVQCSLPYLAPSCSSAILLLLFSSFHFTVLTSTSLSCSLLLHHPHNLLSPTATTVVVYLMHLPCNPSNFWFYSILPMQPLLWRSCEVHQVTKSGTKKWKTHKKGKRLDPVY